MPSSVKLGSVNEEKRTLTLALSASKHQAILVISLPRDYPAGAIPTINFGNGTNLDAVGRSKVTKVMLMVVAVLIENLMKFFLDTETSCSKCSGKRKSLSRIANAASFKYSVIHCT